MITWTAEVVPYGWFYLLAAIIFLVGFFISATLEKLAPLVIFLALVISTAALALVSPDSYRVSGELEVVDARAVSVDGKGVYTFSNGVELPGSYEPGETIQLLCVPSTIECVPDDGDLQNAKKLKFDIYDSVKEQGVPLGSVVQGLSLERHAEAD